MLEKLEKLATVQSPALGNKIINPLYAIESDLWSDAIRSLHFIIRLKIRKTIRILLENKKKYQR